MTKEQLSIDTQKALNELESIAALAANAKDLLLFPNPYSKDEEAVQEMIRTKVLNIEFDLQKIRMYLPLLF